jgi:hypothetical protein
MAFMLPVKVRRWSVGRRGGGFVPGRWTTCLGLTSICFAGAAPPFPSTATSTTNLPPCFRTPAAVRVPFPWRKPTTVAAHPFRRLALTRLCSSTGWPGG